MDEAELLRRFLACSLPREAWTHAAHVTVAVHLIRELGPEQAHAELRERIRALNTSLGIANTDTGGYHDTLTGFFVRAITRELAGNSTLARILEGPLGKSDAPLRCYSRELLRTVEARRSLVPPDRAPI